MRYPRAASVVAFAAIALGLGAGLTACSDDSDGGGSVPVYHEGDSITVDNGDEFVIALDGQPVDRLHVGRREERQREARVEQADASPSAPPGAPGTQRMTFKAYKTGSSTLELAYARQFEAGRAGGVDRQLRRHGPVKYRAQRHAARAAVGLHREHLVHLDRVVFEASARSRRCRAARRGRGAHRSSRPRRPSSPRGWRATPAA